MSQDWIRRAFLVVALGVLASPAHSDSGGVSSGLTLLQSQSARAASMGGAFSAISDDIGGFATNPASLASLNSNQLYLAHEKGLTDDSFSQVAFGQSMRKGGVGVNVGYYDGGTIDYFDGDTLKTINAQTDVMGSIGFAVKSHNVSMGVAVKYLSSQLVESARANATAGDFGMAVDAGPRFRVGGSVQNIGTQLKYASTAGNLPRLARIGLAYKVPFRIPFLFLADAVYLMNEQSTRAGVGMEIPIGILDLRAGYKTGSQLEGLTVGTGFVLNSIHLDYAFGLAQDQDGRHQISIAYHFGIASKSDLKDLPTKQDPEKELPLNDEEIEFPYKDSVDTEN